MEIRLPYGKDEKVLRVPDGVGVDFLAPREPPPVEELPDTFARACRNPVGGVPLEELARSASSVVILVSDLTRSRGADVILPLCISYLESLGVRTPSIRIVVARGTHRKLARSEKAFFRKGPLAGIALEEHDCDESERLSALLLTSRGTPVRVNIALKDAGLVIVLAPISFHYFAGFGGGRKLILPGCADRHAILANHRLSLLDGRKVTLHPSCRPGVLEGNPVSDDMRETVSALQRVCAVNFFADRAGNIVFLNAGDLVRSHEEACEAYRAAHVCEIDDAYGIVVMSAGGYPYDINFLQSHKPLRHCAGAFARGAAVLYYAECTEGVGSAALESALKRKKEEFLRNALKQYELNNQTVVSLYDLSANHEIGVVSSVNVDILLACGLKPCLNPEVFLANALERRGLRKIAVIEEGHNLLPRLRQESGGAS
jgi:nickel-dependent lactate racemase